MVVQYSLFVIGQNASIVHLTSAKCRWDQEVILRFSSRARREHSASEYQWFASYIVAHIDETEKPQEDFVEFYQIVLVLRGKSEKLTEERR